MLFCCEEAFHGSVEAFFQVFGQKLSVDTLEKNQPANGRASRDIFAESRGNSA
jgi:hypothetical protein